MADIPSHHFIYGQTVDFVTGLPLVDTDDERIRQRLSRLLVEEKGFTMEELEPRLKIETLFGGHYVVSLIDLAVKLDGRRIMILRYGPGSLVTREKPALAAARILDPESQIPLTVVTNGSDAEILDTETGKVIATGLAAIPDRSQALLVRLRPPVPPPGPARREKELRILNAFDFEHCCVGGPCALPGAKEG